MRTRLAVLGVSCITLLSPFFASAQSIEALLAQLQQLQAIIAQLSQQSQNSSSASCPALSRTLERGMRGEDVRQLQQFLITKGLLAGDSATGFFGVLTEAAVQQFQCQQGIVCSGGPNAGHGAVGPRTRATIAAQCASSPPQSTVSGSKAITGWAWEGEDQDQNGSLDGGIGWVALHCSSTPVGCSSTGGNWGLTLAPNGAVNGYAWSSNIGWITAAVSGCPRQPCSPAVGSDGKFSGWLRALAAGDGWDGWISLGDTNTSDGANYGVALAGTTVSGFAWGGDIVGWLRFNGSTATLPTSPGPTCTPAYECADSTHRRNVCSTQLEYCGDGFMCSAGICIPLSSAGSLVAIPTLVPSGGTTNVSWSASGVTSCTVSGTNGDTWTGGAIGSPRASSSLSSQTRYTLTCIETSSGASRVIDTKTVNIAPVVNEN